MVGARLVRWRAGCVKMGGGRDGCVYMRALEAQRECIGAAVHDQDGHDGDDDGQQGELPDQLEDFQPEVERGLALPKRRLPQRSAVKYVLDLQ